jgi:hypothetical protein
MAAQKAIWLAKMVCHYYGSDLSVIDVWGIHVAIYPLAQEDAKKVIKVVC